MSRIEKLRQMLDADPKDAFVLYGIAQEHAKTGDHAGAVGYYDRCLAADPNYTYAYYHKAVSQIESGQREQAVETIKTGLAVAKSVKDGKALNELTTLLDQIT